MSPEEVLLLNGLKESIDTLFKYREEDRKVYIKILEQTTKTNGRVTAIEKTQKDCPVKDLQKETETTRFFTKHPKLLRATLVGFFILNFGLLSSFLVTLNKLNTITDDFQQYKKEHLHEQGSAKGLN